MAKLSSMGNNGTEKLSIMGNNRHGVTPSGEDSSPPRSSSILLHSPTPVALWSGHGGAATCEAVCVLCTFAVWSQGLVDLVLLRCF